MVVTVVTVLPELPAKAAPNAVVAQMSAIRRPCTLSATG
jgi:hypothetical protein